jgi:hypothetical protein
MHLMRLSLLLFTISTGGPLVLAEDGAATATASSEIEKATVTGTVTALNPQRHSFTLKETGADEFEYRAYFRDGKQKPMLETIAGLKVGDVLTVTYTESEGRRALTVTTPAPATK